MRPFTSTIFAEMSALALRTGAINLGQGFPDSDGPASLLADAAANITGGINQYPPGIGIPELRGAVAEHQRRFYGAVVDPADVLVTTGATEAIASAVLGLCDPGDEVLTFEPYYDSYAATVALASARLRTVALRPPSFDFDPDELRAAFSPRTRLVLVNTPHNPTGAVFTREQSGVDRRAGHGERRRDRRPTRCTSTWCSTGGPTSRWRRCRAWPSGP